MNAASYIGMSEQYYADDDRGYDAESVAQCDCHSCGTRRRPLARNRSDQIAGGLDEQSDRDCKEVSIVVVQKHLSFWGWCLEARDAFFEIAGADYQACEVDYD